MKKVTKADLDKTLRELGYKEGDELPVPSEKTNADASTQDTESGESEGGEDDGEGGGGGNNPPHKPPFK
jgi:hypothetical protein